MLSIVIHQGVKSDQELKAEIGRQELKQRPQRNAASWLMQPVFLYNPDHLPSSGINPRELDHTHQSLTKRMHHRLVYKQILLEAFS